MISDVIGINLIIRKNDFINIELKGSIVNIDKNNKILLIELDKPFTHSNITYEVVLFLIQ